jgi:hypothetical protein
VFDDELDLADIRNGDLMCNPCRLHHGDPVTQGCVNPCNQVCPVAKADFFFLVLHVLHIHGKHLLLQRPVPITLVGGQCKQPKGRPRLNFQVRIATYATGC